MLPKSSELLGYILQPKYFCDSQVKLFLPDRIEVPINGLGSFLGLSHLDGDIGIAGPGLVFRLKTLGTKDYADTESP